MTFKLIKTGLAALALLAVPFAAQAADMPIKGPYYKGTPRSVIAYYNWTGFYAGIVAGYAFGSSDWTSPAVSNSPTGFLAGGTIGYNWQSGAIVYGVEGDWSWSNVKDSVRCGAVGTCETRQDWFGTARGRIGYAFDRWLPYVTGGAAFARLKATNTNPGFSSATSTQIGWTAGVGLEYAILGNWTAKIEYLYADLGSFDCGTACGPLASGNNVSFTENIVRAGLNYKFSGPIFSRF
jgi:outer membrane immunogenic protein